MQITYNTQNLAGAGCYERRDTGLSGFGREVVAISWRRYSDGSPRASTRPTSKTQRCCSTRSMHRGVCSQLSQPRSPFSEYCNSANTRYYDGDKPGHPFRNTATLQHPTHSPNSAGSGSSFTVSHEQVGGVRRHAAAEQKPGIGQASSAISRSRTVRCAAGWISS
jgi:hypothetical protein